MSRHNAAWWSKRVAELGRGGDAEQIASNHGVRVTALKWWRWEFARRGRKAGPRMLPVVVESPVERSSAGDEGGIEVVVEWGQVRVSVRGRLTAEHLAALMASAPRKC